MKEVLFASVRPGIPSTSDSFWLLRVAARRKRGSRVGPDVVRQAAAAEQQCPVGMSVRGGRRHHEPNQCTVERAGMGVDLTTKEEGG